MKSKNILFIFLLGISSCKNEKKSEVQNTVPLETINQFINKNKENRDHWKKEGSFSTWKADAGNIGFWALNKDSLPEFHFTAQLPSRTFNKINQEINEPSDPWFILGNYYFNSFINASGTYSLLSMERGIARLNYSDEARKNISYTTLNISGKQYDLTGINSKIATSDFTEKVFGTGFARFQYSLPDGIKIKRTLSTLPSENTKQGCPGMLFTIEIENTSKAPVDFDYTEGLQVKYDLRYWHNWPFIDPLASYPVKAVIDENTAMVRFVPKEKVPLVFGDSLGMGRADGFPPAVYLEVIPGLGQKAQIKAITSKDSLSNDLSAQVSSHLESGKKTTFNFIVGYSAVKQTKQWIKLTEKLRNGAKDSSLQSFNNAWKKQLPTFENEKDALIKMEMQWHAYVLYSMASHNEFYNEVYIPQGNVYEYELGVSACMNDWMDQVLPVCHYDPELARSILRFGLQHADYQGNLIASDEGMGRIPKAPWLKSHSQLYLLMALGEYFKQTKDAGFLLEEIPFSGYPNTKGTVLDRMERIFFNQRDVNYIGKHGLARALLSDNNDVLYYFFHNNYPNIDFPTYFGNAESMANAGMSALYLPELADALLSMENDPKARSISKLINLLASALSIYKNDQLEALQKNWGNQPHSVRVYIGDKVMGKDTIFGDVQCYMMGIKDLTIEKRKALWKIANEKLGNGEKKGLRYTDKAISVHANADHEESFSPGEHEAGGIWYYTNAPIIIGYSDIDKEASYNAFKKLTLLQHAKDFPNYWIGMWSAPDAINSSLSPNEGTSSLYTRKFPIYCAHPHAWTLYMYYKLNK